MLLKGIFNFLPHIFQDTNDLKLLICIFNFCLINFASSQLIFFDQIFGCEKLFFVCFYIPQIFRFEVYEIRFPFNSRQIKTILYFFFKKSR